MQNNSIEIGMFKLKEGVQLENAVITYQSMIKNYLSQQSGWQAQSLICLEDGILIDLAWAENIDTSKLICSLWEKSEHCLEFLSLIEPISMQFGQVISGP